VQSAYGAVPIGLQCYEAQLRRSLECTLAELERVQAHAADAGAAEIQDRDGANTLAAAGAPVGTDPSLAVGSPEAIAGAPAKSGDEDAAETAGAGQMYLYACK
jgi:hypothetical protein